ncbi:unnamed protein product [Trichogramma brassicae]|uniref:Uncharacterized protein n=1 Tax=Trichogramma brassicae TaxID=86971 RepID=A0A6H5HT45_9HYME|nr:unnamed protein product [Trichogramma brassicae]
MLGNVGIRLTKIKTIDVLVTTHAEVCPNVILLLAGYIVENHQRVGRASSGESTASCSLNALAMIPLHSRAWTGTMRLYDILPIYRMLSLVHIPLHDIIGSIPSFSATSMSFPYIPRPPYGD